MKTFANLSTTGVLPVRFPLHRKHEVAFARIVGTHQGRLGALPDAAFGVQSDDNASLASRRDLPIISGDMSPSAGQNLRDAQSTRASIPDPKGVHIIPALFHQPEVIARFRNFDAGSRAGLKGRLYLSRSAHDGLLR